MDGAPHFPHPSNMIEIDKDKCVEWPVERSFSYSLSTLDFSKSSSRSRMAPSSSDRFNYVIVGNSILVFDLFLGIGKKVLPKDSIDVLGIIGYIYLSPNRGFLIYQTSSESNYSRLYDNHPIYRERISTISIDVDEGIYDFVGNFYDIPDYSESLVYYGYSYNFCPVNQIIFVHDEICRRLSIFYLDSASFGIKSHQIMKIPETAFLFTLIDGKLIFANAGGACLRYFNLYNFQTIENDNSFIEIENTGVEIEFEKMDPPPRIAGSSSSLTFIRINIHGRWHASKTFICSSIIFQEALEDGMMPVIHQVANPTILMFELETKVWSEIQLNLPLNRAFYQFHISDSGILNVIAYSKIGENPDKSLKFSTALIRVPLRKPDNLINLCCFQARKFGLLNKFAHLKNLI